MFNPVMAGLVFVMARLDRAIALFIALLLMARSSRTMTLRCLTFQRFWVRDEFVNLLPTCAAAQITRQNHSAEL
jgi:hypothetical protein